MGLFYTAASRPTTIGRSDDKMSSAIYFDGPDFSRERITGLTKDKKGKLYRKAALRQKWVNYMKTNSRDQKQYTEKEMNVLFEWIEKTKFTLPELDSIVKTNDSKK